MLRLQPNELSFGRVELNKTYTKLLTLINEQQTPLDFAIRPSNRERYTVYPSSINLPANSSTTVQVQLRVEKFANRKRAETKGQRDSFKITSRYFEQKIWSTWSLQPAHRSDSAPSENENSSTEAIEFPSDHHRRHLNDRLDLFNRFAVKVDGSNTGNNNLDQAAATSFDDSDIVRSSERGGSTSLRKDEDGRPSNHAPGTSQNADTVSSVATTEPTPFTNGNSESERSKTQHKIAHTNDNQREAHPEGVRERVHDGAGTDGINHSRSNNASVFNGARDGSEALRSGQEHQQKMPPAHQHRQSVGSLQNAQDADTASSSLHDQPHRRLLRARDAEVHQLRAQLSILEGRLASRESELVDCRQQMAMFRQRSMKLEEENSSLRGRLQSQVRRTEEYASKQHRQASHQLSSDSEDPEQVRFEGRVALDRSETQIKQLQEKNGELQQRNFELERGLKLLRSVIYSPTQAVSQHDLKFAGSRTETNAEDGTLAREHKIIQQQSDMLLAVRRELVSKTAQYTGSLRQLEAQVRAAERAKHAAECELHWKKRNQDARVRSLEGLLHLKRDAVGLSPSQRLAAVALQLQEEQARATKLQVELSRAALREAAAREEAAAVKAAADTASEDLEALRLTLSCVGIGVQPAEAVAKLLNSLRSQVGKQKSERAVGRSASTPSMQGVDDHDPSRLTDARADRRFGSDADDAGVSQNFYSSESLAVFEDLVQNVMMIQNLDAAASMDNNLPGLQESTPNANGATPARLVEQARVRSRNASSSSSTSDDNHPDSRVAVVNHSFLIACLRLVGSVRAAWARESDAEERAARVVHEANKADSTFQSNLLILQESHRNICQQYQEMLDDYDTQLQQSRAELGVQTIKARKLAHMLHKRKHDDGSAADGGNRTDKVESNNDAEHRMDMLLEAARVCAFCVEGNFSGRLGPGSKQRVDENVQQQRVVDTLQARIAELEMMVRELQGTASVLKHAASAALEKRVSENPDGATSSSARFPVGDARGNTDGASGLVQTKTSLQEKILGLSVQLVDSNETCSQLRRRMEHLGRELLAAQKDTAKEATARAEAEAQVAALQDALEEMDIASTDALAAQDKKQNPAHDVIASSSASYPWRACHDVPRSHHNHHHHHQQQQQQEQQHRESASPTTEKRLQELSMGLHSTVLEAKLDPFQIPLVSAATAATVLTGIRCSDDSDSEESLPPHRQGSHFSAVKAQEVIYGLRRQVKELKNAAEYAIRRVKIVESEMSAWQQRQVKAEESGAILDVELRRIRMAHRALGLKAAALRHENDRYARQVAAQQTRYVFLQRRCAILQMDKCKLKFRLRSKLQALRTYPLNKALKTFGPKIVQMVSSSIIDNLECGQRPTTEANSPQSLNDHATLAHAIESLDKNWAVAFSHVRDAQQKRIHESSPAENSRDSDPKSVGVEGGHVCLLPASTLECLLQHLAATLLQNYEFSLRFQQMLGYHDALVLYAKLPSGGGGGGGGCAAHTIATSNSDAVPPAAFAANVASFLGENDDRAFLKPRNARPQIPKFPCSALNASMLHEATRALHTRKLALEVSERALQQELSEAAERKGRQVEAGTQTPASAPAGKYLVMLTQGGRCDASAQTTSPTPAEAKLNELSRVVTGSVDAVARGIGHALEFTASSTQKFDDHDEAVFTAATSELQRVVECGRRVSLAPGLSDVEFVRSLQTVAAVFDAASALVANSGILPAAAGASGRPVPSTHEGHQRAHSASSDEKKDLLSLLNSSSWSTEKGDSSSLTSCNCLPESECSCLADPPGSSTTLDGGHLPRNDHHSTLEGDSAATLVAQHCKDFEEDAVENSTAGDTPLRSSEDHTTESAQSSVSLDSSSSTLTGATTPRTRIKHLSCANKRKTDLIRGLHERLSTLTDEVTVLQGDKLRLVGVARQYAQDLKSKSSHIVQLTSKINELRDRVEELTSTRERQSRKIRKLTEKVGRLHDRLLPPWPPKPSPTKAATRCDQNRRSETESSSFAVPPATPEHGNTTAATTTSSSSSGSKTTGSSSSSSSMPRESDASDFHSSTDDSRLEDDENSPPSEAGANAARGRASDGASRTSSSFQQVPPPPPPLENSSSYMKKQLQTVVRRKDVAIKNLREQLQARDTKLRELQASAETMRARHRRRVLRLEVDARAELQRRHAVASAEVQQLLERENSILDSIRIVFDSLLAGNAALRNQLRDQIEPEFLDVSTESEDSFTCDVAAADDDSIRQTEASSIAPRQRTTSGRHERAPRHMKDDYRQRKKELFNKHAQVLGLQPREVRRLLHASHAHADAAEGHGVDLQSLAKSLTTGVPQQEIAKAVADDPDAHLKLLCARALQGQGPTRTTQHHAKQARGTNGVENKRSNAMDINKKAAAAAAASAASAASAKLGSTARDKLQERPPPVDCAVLQHALAELVSERVRLQMLQHQFALSTSNASPAREAANGGDGDAAAAAAVLRASIFNYETILKEVKTQLLAEHQARVALRTKFKKMLFEAQTQEEK